jgi:hypothetical protein
MVAIQPHTETSCCQIAPMPWLDDVLTRLASAKQWSYLQGQPSSAEPTAFSALALVAHGQAYTAKLALDWLVEHQSPDGSIGVTETQDTPIWPTSLAILAWKKAQETTNTAKYATAIARGTDALLQVQAVTIPVSDVFGHDTTLVGWPWVAGTHSWLEPTAFAVLAFKAIGQETHPRVRQGVQLIIDRLLPEGGANYGNTFVLGQRLRPHVQPSGIALAAVADEPSDLDGRIERTVTYLQDQLSAETTTSSLSFALLGLAVANALPANAEQWLAAAAGRTLARQPAPYKLALLALAAKASELPLKSHGGALSV